MSTVDNFQKYCAGEISIGEAFADAATDVGKAGAIGYGTGFVTAAVARAASASGSQLIKSLGNSSIPGAVISWGVASFESITDYAQGEIDGKELASDLAENAVSVAGSIAGAALAGAALGSVVPGAGTVAGFAVGLVGGMVGTVIATEAFETAVSLGAETVTELANKIEQTATNTIELAKEAIPEKVENVKNALNDFFADRGVSIHL